MENSLKKEIERIEYCIENNKDLQNDFNEFLKNLQLDRKNAMEMFAYYLLDNNDFYTKFKFHSENKLMEIVNAILLINYKYLINNDTIKKHETRMRSIGRIFPKLVSSFKDGKTVFADGTIM